MIGTMKCAYETPCGWCTKWDKKCDEKPYRRSVKVKVNPIDHTINIPKEEFLANKICMSESDHEWECCGVSTGGSTYRCRKCGSYKTEPVKNQENTTISTHFNEASIPCYDCVRVGTYSPQCIDCNVSNGFKYFEREKNK